MRRVLTLRSIPVGWPFLLAVAGILLPIVYPDPTTMTIAVFTLIYATLTTAWNIFSGYTGYISLGHSTFFGFGAYTMALIAINRNLEGGFGLFLLLPIAGLVAALLAIPVGWIALRTRGHAFVVITLFTVFIFQLLAFDRHDITNGSTGLFLPIPQFFSDAATNRDYFVWPFYYVQLAVLLVALAVSRYVRSSKYGLGLLAIRDDEDRAAGLGVRTGVSKLSALVISAFFTGMAGAMFAYFVGSIYPQYVFDPALTIGLVLMAFLGGAGTLFGPILGALILEPTQQELLLRSTRTGVYQVILGALFLIVMLLMPEGIVRSLGKLWTWWRARRGAGVSPVAPEPTPVAAERG
jgi:branched-chain amino acid transport system permease protein